MIKDYLGNPDKEPLILTREGFAEDPSNVASKADLDAHNCEHCKGSGWQWAFGCEVKCTRHTPHISNWLRYKANRLAAGEYPPPQWMFVRMGEEYPPELNKEDT